MPSPVASFVCFFLNRRLNHEEDSAGWSLVFLSFTLFESVDFSPFLVVASPSFLEEVTAFYFALSATLCPFLNTCFSITLPVESFSQIVRLEPSFRSQIMLSEVARLNERLK
jgi:hypothetical protein